MTSKNIIDTHKISISEINFTPPSKNKENIYTSSLTEPIHTQLPKLNILSTGKNSRGQYELWYHLDLESENGERLVNFCYMLDNVALSRAHENSETWFVSRFWQNRKMEGFFSCFFSCFFVFEKRCKLFFVVFLFSENHENTFRCFVAFYCFQLWSFFTFKTCLEHG